MILVITGLKIRRVKDIEILRKDGRSTGDYSTAKEIFYKDGDILQNIEN